MERGETGWDLLYKRRIFFQQKKRNEEIRGCNSGSLELECLDCKIAFIKWQGTFLKVCERVGIGGKHAVTWHDSARVVAS